MHDICANKQGNNRLTVIAFNNLDNHPVALITFQKKDYNPMAIEQLPNHNVGSEVLQTRRKSLWEVQYLVRRSELRSKCLGDLLIGCGLEALCQCVRGNTTNVWLIVSNSFINISALRLYLNYGFRITGMYQSALMMIVTCLDDEKAHKVRTHMERQIESCYLLPDLKKLQSHLSDHSVQQSATSSTSQQSPTTQEVIDSMKHQR